MTAPDPQIEAHVLVVDDDSRIRDLLGRFLRKSGYLVTTARDAAQARRLLTGLDFDLIVLDVMMPGEDGFALTRHLRRLQAYINVNAPKIVRNGNTKTILEK